MGHYMGHSNAITMPHYTGWHVSIKKCGLKTELCRCQSALSTFSPISMALTLS